MLLDAVVDFLPSPLEIPPKRGYNPDNKEEVIIRQADDNESPMALVFKIASDPYVGTISINRGESKNPTLPIFILPAKSTTHEPYRKCMNSWAD